MLRVDTYQLRRSEPELAVIFLYPWGGERHNNASLLQDLALLTGGLVLGVQTPGTGKLYIDRATRKRLRPGRFQSLAEDFAGETKELLDAHGQPLRVLAAQSGRVAPGARMQLSRHRPFTHVVLRDGVNLCAPESVRDGRRRLLSLPIEPLHGRFEDTRNLMYRLRDRRARAHQVVELLNHGELMCSTESRDAMEALARDITTPALHITFREGAAGPTDRQQRFQALLRGIRLSTALRSPNGLATAPLEACVLPGRHSDLQNPILLHEHINYALSLTRQNPPGNPPRLLPEQF